MPTINKRFLLVLILIAGGVTGGLFAVHSFQARRIPDALLRMADRAAENDKRDAAIRYLRQYLEFCPTDTDARERLVGLMRARRSPHDDPTHLIFLYDKILRADPNRHASRREALALSLAIGRNTDAATHAEFLLKQFPTDSGLWEQLAAAQAGMNKQTEAKASYETAIRHAPTDLLIYQKLAQFTWREMKLPEDARKVLDRAVAAMPFEPEPLLTRAKFDLFSADGMPAAGTTPRDPMPDIQKALEIDPENADALLLLAEQYQKRRDLASAKDCLADGVRLYPKDGRLVRSLSWLELNRGNIGAAVGILEDGMARSPNGFDLLVPLADLLVQLGETTRTEEIVARLEKRRDATAKLQVKYLRARLAMRQQKWPAATDLLVQLRNESIGLPGLETQANLLLAGCYQKRGDREKEQDTLKLVLNRDPNHHAARVALALSLMNGGQYEDAEKEQQQAVKSPFAMPSTHAMLLRMKSHLMSTGNTGTAATWSALERVAGELPKAFGPGSSEPVRIRAELELAQGKIAEAAKVLRTEAIRRPGDTALWADLASTVADLAGVAAGLTVLDEAQAASGDGADLRLARADLYARDPAKLRPLDMLANQIDTWPDPEQLKLLYGLAEVYDRVGDDAAAVRTYQRIAARRPADVAVWETLAERCASRNDSAALAAARTALAKLDPTGGSVALCDAWAALAAAKPDGFAPAIEAVKKIYGTTPDRADACVALGKLYAAAGDSGKAAEYLDRAVRLDPTRFGPVRAYLANLARTGPDDAISAAVARLGRDYRWAGDSYRRAIRGAAIQAGPVAGKKLLDASKPFAERVPGGLGWLGDSYLALGAKPEAAGCYQAAVASKTATADDWLRLAVRTAEAGEPVESAIFAARKALPGPAFVTTMAAFADSAVAPKDWSPELATPAEKRAFAQARLAVKLSRFQRAEAAEVLEAFLKTDDLPAPDAAWAKRNLAMLLAIRAGSGDRAKAMALLTKADTANDSPDDLRASAAVLSGLARYLDGAERTAVLEKATAALEAVVAETKSPRDGFLLAHVYRAAGNRKASTETMNKLLAADPKNLDYHLFALEELSELGQFAAAEPFAQRVIALYPSDFRAVAAVAKFECRAGRPDRGFVLAEGYTRTADATAGDLPAKSARSAELLDDLSRLPGVKRTDVGRAMVKSAVEKYAALAATRPEAVVAAAGLLAVDGRGAEAFPLISKHSRDLTPKVRASAGLAVLRAGEGTDQQFATVRGWLDDAFRADPDAVGTRLLEGEFFALKKEFASAEASYRAVLERDPRNVVALNNLAWVLAPRPEASEAALTLIDRAVAEIGYTGELLDTRARVRIASKQFDMAERDLKAALTQEKTPLRMFHMALAKQGQTPPKPSEAAAAFKQAVDRGLEPTAVHPDDLPMYRVLEAGPK